MLISYNWLKSYIPQLPKPEEISGLITYHICEVENVEKKDNDTIFDLDILPDRAHDLLSHQGVARELASLLGLNFDLPEYKIPTVIKSNLKIKIETNQCRRYMGRIVRNIKIKPSPKWMVDYLESIGQRSINNIVDATNIVMFDCGQPIHAFDLAKLSSEMIVVKNAKKGEELKLVGSKKITVKLIESNMVITDGEKNLAVAGVKGGIDSGISDDTKDILIEVANFKPTSIRKTAKILGIQTDATKRYENNLSPNLCDFAMKKFSSLLFEMFPEAKFEEVVDEYIVKPEIKEISFSTEYISKMLGIKIKDEEIEKILKDYNYVYKDNWIVEVPDMRIDITAPCNMVEEIGRVYGYNKITSEIPPKILQGEDDPIWTKILVTKEQLIKDDYKEVMTYTFRDKGEVEVLASASDKNFLRTNLTDGLKESLKLNRINAPLLGRNEIKIFEVGTVFLKDKEEIHVCFNDKKNIIEMTLEQFMKEKNLSINKINLLDNLKLNLSEKKIFKLWSVYPFIARDISVWVPEETSSDELRKIYQELGTDLLVNKPYLFDQFTKDHKTSYAFRLVFQSYKKTLTDDEINIIMAGIEKKISSLGWIVR